MAQALHDRFDLPVVFTLRVRLADGQADLGKVCDAVFASGGRVSEAGLVEHEPAAVIQDLTVFVRDDAHMTSLGKDLSQMPGLAVLSVTDVALESHRGGASECRSRAAIKSNTDLRIIYTPGVARVCKAIQADPAKARQYTAIANKVAIATNGTAILGLGDIGALAGLPVMEGKAAIFWEFAGVSAEPVLVDTHDPKEFIHVIEKIAVGYGAIQIEDVAAPECFEITRVLDERLPIPVFHDDQHGTATIVLAGLYSALKLTSRKIGDVRCAISGAGAAGTAIADLLLLAGVADVVLCDRAGAIYRGRTEHMNPSKVALAERTNKDNLRGSLADVMKGRELLIGVSQPNIVSQDMVRSMAKGPMVFALANPISEISVTQARSAGAAVAADGRMMNNALAYPGIFRGALDAQARSITVEMLMAAAKALADRVPPGGFMPEMMDPQTHQAVAEAVRNNAGPGQSLVI